MKIISVVTPSFNQGRFISETIKSVITQEGEFYIDYIVQDGGSTDETKTILSDWLLELQKRSVKKILNKNFYTPNKDDKIIRCLGVAFSFESEKDKGHANAINLGFKHTVGAIMAWINSDDKYHEDAFSHVVKAFDIKQVQWLVGCNSWWKESGELLISANIWRNKWDFLTGRFGWLQQESTFWSRELWLKSGGYINENYSLVPDGELWCRFFLYDQPTFTENLLGGYRVHGVNRAILHQDKLLKEMSEVLTEFKKRQNIFSRIQLLTIKFLRKYLVRFENYLTPMLKVWGYKLLKNGSIIKKPYKLANQVQTEISAVYQVVKENYKS